MRHEWPLLAGPAVPAYLERTYWWAYVRPRAIRFWDRPWLINLILWGNYRRLRDAALDALGTRLEGRTLQIACVYGDLSERLLARLAPAARLDIVDVVPAQLANTARKLGGDARVGLIHGDGSGLDSADRTYDCALAFFLLHEQPREVRLRTLAEAWRVLKPGGRLVIVDYHRPRPWHPLYWPMVAVLRTLEPFALDLWREGVAQWLPRTARGAAITRRTFFAGLYQLVTLTK